MFENQQACIPSRVNRVGFALLMGLGAGVGIGARAGNSVASVAIGVAVFLLFSLEL